MTKRYRFKGIEPVLMCRYTFANRFGNVGAT
jgi:hypothetical protein